VSTKPCDSQSGSFVSQSKKNVKRKMGRLATLQNTGDKFLETDNIYQSLNIDKKKNCFTRVSRGKAIRTKRENNYLERDALTRKVA